MQVKDTNWEFSKKFNTKVGKILTHHENTGEKVKNGQRVLLVKEVGV